MWLTHTMPARNDFTVRNALKMSRVQTAAAKSVRRIVRDLHRIFFVFERDYRSHWAKNLFASNARAVIEIVENCGLDVIAFGKLLSASATGCELALFLTDLLIGRVPGRIDLYLPAVPFLYPDREVRRA